VHVVITYQTDLSGIREEDLDGFFVDWPTKPSPERHLALMRGSAHVVVARDEQHDRIVGFVTAIADGEVSAFIPLLEVLPEYHGRGIGTELMRRMLELLEPYYMVDLCCDAELVPFYRRFGMLHLEGMALRILAALAD
jgi:ribosomal protein S18 acetylase RimI-like enzyme